MVNLEVRWAIVRIRPGGVGGEQRTYNTGHSLVVTDPTTTPALIGLTMGERTGSRILQWVWSYVHGRSIGRVCEVEQLVLLSYMCEAYLVCATSTLFQL
jgi:hypothetical protein